MLPLWVESIVDYWRKCVANRCYLLSTGMSAPLPPHGSPQSPMDHSTCKVVSCPYFGVYDIDDPVPNTQYRAVGIDRHCNK